MRYEERTEVGFGTVTIFPDGPTITVPSPKPWPTEGCCYWGTAPNFGASPGDDTFAQHLSGLGWEVTPEVDFCDLVAERDGERLYVEAKGRTAAIGTDVDTMYGQILRRMPLAEDPSPRFAVVVPTRAQHAALRVPPRVRALLSIEVFVVSDEGAVSGPL